MSQLVQMNLTVEDEVAARVERLHENYNWSKRQVVTEAVKLLWLLTEGVAENVEPDLADFYRRVAREAPTRLIELNKDSMLGRSGKQPVFLLDGRYIYATPEADALMAVDHSGRRHWRYEDGEFIPVQTPSPEDTDLKPITS